MATLPSERTIVLGAFAVIFAIQLELVFNRPVNWDEFYHLSQVHAQSAGRLTEVLQVLHVRLLGWIAALPLDEIGQVRVARLVMLGCEMVTLGTIYAMARHFAEARTALFTPLLYLAAGNTLQHGFSFRADPLVTALLMGALWLLLTSRLGWKHLAAVAILLSLAMLATIKSLLYSPAFAGIVWYRLANSSQPRHTAARMGLMGLTAVALFTAWVILTQLAVPNGSATGTAKASRDMLFAEGLFPRWHYILIAIGISPIFFAALGAAAQILRGSDLAKVQRLALAGLTLPLLSVVYYRNAYPYFYAFILAPVAVGMVPGIAWLVERYTARSVAFGCVLSAFAISALTPRPVLDEQRLVLREVHRLFPQPVAYFDFCGMVPQFAKANVFMSTWGQTRYRLGEVPSYRDTVARQEVPLLLANNDVLMRNQSAAGPAWELLPGDSALLRQGYVQHWGPIWVAGHRFAGGSSAGEFEIHAGGTYTLEGAAAKIDGRRHEPGEVLFLNKGPHRFAPLDTGEALLRWGDHLSLPSAPPPVGIPFRDF